ncbi:MAG TPA: hypothetical protein DD417_05515 [Elusimicrobia bacterium]|nr:MAG: hypothetical protein A3K12_04555 [Candidatus Rokubacteria bacterium RIFCSPLOWO2_12_FULL_71_19]HBL16220.1 hypothetical protein [Elusimicrobiota bacterium]
MAVVTACAFVAGAAPALAGPEDAEAGRGIFAAKQCVRCHLPRGEPGFGPPLEEIRRPQGAMELAGRLWNHVPAMAGALAQGGVEWPRIGAQEMAALMAYLQADARRDAEPDLYKGQVALLRKGCLKCHSLRREGGRVEPDLAERRADYESAAAWAAAMWTHTPRMAAMAGRLGVPYPRFAGDEMGNLLGFLKEAAAAPLAGPKAAPKR